MSTAPGHAETLPRGALITALALVLFALAGTALTRIGHLPPVASPEALRTRDHVAPVRSRALRFTDRADGAVVIADVRTGATALTIEPGGQTGFIRGVMRGLARERRMRGIGDGPPFRLTLWRDGELSLTDTATGRSIELGAFGGTNRASFAVLLDARDARR